MPERILEDVYLKAIEASPDAIVVIDENGDIIVFNVQAELMFGYSRVEVLGKKVEILIPTDVREKHVTHRENYIYDPKIRDMGIGMVLNGLHRKGKTFPIQIKLSPMIIAQAGLHTMAVIRKVSN